MRGRKPKSFELKLLTGNPGKQSLKPVVAMPVPEKPPKAPRHLDPEAKREWRRTVPELMRLGIFSALYVPAFSGYVWAFSQFIKASQALDEKGLTYEVNGMARVRPEFRIAEAASRLMREFASEFGLTPLSRSRIHVKPQKERSLSEIARERAAARREADKKNPA